MTRRIQTGFATQLRWPTKWGGLVRVDESSAEPLTVTQVKLHRRNVPEAVEDQLIDDLIKAARRYFEDYLQRGCKPLTITAHYPYFGDALQIPLPPLRSLTEITYRDTDDQLQTLDPADYQVDLSQMPAFVIPSHNVTWPSTIDRGLPVIVTAEVGYVTLPEPITQHLYQWVGLMYENREMTSPLQMREVPYLAEALAAYRLAVT